MSPLEARELTPRGRGAVAVFALEGQGALERVRALCRGPTPEVGRLALVRLCGAGEALDQALVVALSEERVELHLHGSPPLVRRVLALIGAAAAEESVRGLRLEERAALLLAAAPCEAAARILLDQQEGALRGELEALRAAPRPEQDLRLDCLLERARVARYALVPARLLLAGPVNAGKSTLFNAVHGSERVLVSAERGTTRDVIRERSRLGAWPVDLCDAPGEREPRREAPAALRLELEGLRIARELAAGAELVVWLSPAPEEPIAPPADLGAVAGRRLVVVTSRADLLGPPARAAREPSLCALLEPGEAARTLEGLFRRALGLPAEPWLCGSPTPFEDQQVALLRRARMSESSAERGQLLSRLLEPWPAPCGRVDPLGDRG